MRLLHIFLFQPIVRKIERLMATVRISQNPKIYHKNAQKRSTNFEPSVFNNNYELQILFA